MVISFDPVFQTKGDQGTKETRERFGVIHGHNNPWLGEGYYFWDGHIELAQWWGEKHYHGHYVICQAVINVEGDSLFDMVGNTQHQRLFITIINELRKKNPHEEFTVAAVLMDMQKHSASFRNIKAIRARSEHLVPQSEKLRFVHSDKGYMVTIPAIQICVRDLSLINEYHELPTDNIIQVV